MIFCFLKVNILVDLLFDSMDDDDGLILLESLEVREEATELKDCGVDGDDSVAFVGEVGEAEAISLL